MIPIQALLSRLRFDPEFARGRWEIAYLDRTQPGLVRLPVRTRSHIEFVFDVIDQEGIERSLRSHPATAKLSLSCFRLHLLFPAGYEMLVPNRLWGATR